jgi:hypothetical protein
MPCVALPLLSGVYLPVHERIMLDVGHRGAINERLRRESRDVEDVDGACPLRRLQSDHLNAQGRHPLRVGFPRRPADLQRHREVVRRRLGRPGAGRPFIECLDQGSGEARLPRAELLARSISRRSSDLLTLPTNDPEKLRGNRAHDLYFDERNFMDEDAGRQGRVELHERRKGHALRRRGVGSEHTSSTPPRSITPGASSTRRSGRRTRGSGASSRRLTRSRSGTS